MCQRLSSIQALLRGIQHNLLYQVDEKGIGLGKYLIIRPDLLYSIISSLFWETCNRSNHISGSYPQLESWLEFPSPL